MLDTMSLARRLVVLHDERGLPLEMSLEMACDDGIRVPLLGLIAEMANRNWGLPSVRGVVDAWQRVYRDLTPAERAACNSF